MPPARLTRLAVASLCLPMLAPSLALSPPVHAAPPRDQRATAGWDARRIGAGAVHRRDRALLRSLPRTARVGYHPETKRVRFLSATPSRPLGAGLAVVISGKRQLTTADAKTRARRFVDRYGGLFGLASPAEELRVSSARRFASGPRGFASGPRRAASAFKASGGAKELSRVVVRLDQVRGGIPVMGGQLIVQVSGRGEVLSVAGEVTPSSTALEARPKVAAARAAELARTWLARQAGRPRGDVTTRSEGLAWYDPRIMGDPNLGSLGTRLVWRIDARLPATRRRAEEHRLVIVDARGGQVWTTIGRLYGLDRAICDNQETPGRAYKCDGPFARTEGEATSGIGDVDAVYRLMGVVDDYLAMRFGRSGIDGQGGRMKATVRYCGSLGCPWRNAEWKWAEQQAIFGSGWARADDIVAHEFFHGVLDHEAPLFYHYQSGAINESLADIFGELIDLSDPAGTDTPATAWRIGEDTPIGAFRDMREPGRFGDPDRVRSPRWFKGSGDDGGVHRNSGVGNKAASLMADGGTFGGMDIAAIGRTRTARIFYQALTTRLTPAANYIDLADALVAACTDLAGDGDITMAHCASVRDATRATQMHLQPQADGATARAGVWPRPEPRGRLRRRPREPRRRALADRAASRPQARAGTTPRTPTTTATWDGTWASSGQLNLYAPNRPVVSDTVMRGRTAHLVPERAFLRFEHGYSFDADARRRYDGGIVEVKVGGGPWRGVKALFTHGGYNGLVARGFGNALAGQRAFTGDSHGWSEARVDLSPFAGQWLKLRFRMASDRAMGERGWYIDDIRIYTCTTDADRPTGTLSINAGAPSTADPHVSVALTYADASTWVTHLRVAGDATLDASGRLAAGIEMSIRDAFSWDLTDIALGGSAGPGMKGVYAQVRDAAGNWSDVFWDEIELLASP